VLYYNLIIAEGIEVTKANLKLGIPWQFGPNWPGQRCEARTRKGTACQRPARLPVGRCRLHGGSSTGPTTEEGLARLIASKIKHGRFTKEKRAEAKRRAEVGRQMRCELAELEAWFVDRGLLDTKWRDLFK
jgi:hypothetical protein